MKFLLTLPLVSVGYRAGRAEMNIRVPNRYNDDKLQLSAVSILLSRALQQCKLAGWALDPLCT